MLNPAASAGKVGVAYYLEVTGKKIAVPSSTIIRGLQLPLKALIDEAHAVIWGLLGGNRSNFQRERD